MPKEFPSLRKYSTPVNTCTARHPGASYAPDIHWRHTLVFVTEHSSTRALSMRALSATLSQDVLRGTGTPFGPLL